MESTINAQTTTFLKADELARIIKEKVFKNEFAVQIYNFFSDVHLQDVDGFLVKYKIPDQVLIDYYNTFIRELYPNRGLEEMLAIGKRVEDPS